jgi:hypothetical protein
MTLPDDVVERLIAIVADGASNAMKFAIGAIIRAALAELAKTHEITPRVSQISASNDAVKWDNAHIIRGIEAVLLDAELKEEPIGRDVLLKVLNDLRKVPTRPVTPELRVGQVWVAGNDSRQIDCITGDNFKRIRVTIYYTTQRKIYRGCFKTAFLAWIARTGATLQETTK